MKKYKLLKDLPMATAWYIFWEDWRCYGIYWFNKNWNINLEVQAIFKYSKKLKTKCNIKEFFLELNDID